MGTLYQEAVGILHSRRMPYVPIPVISRRNLFETAERRWAGLRDARPDLAPALDLQRRLLGIVIDVADALGAGRLPRLTLPPKYIAAKLGRGVPALAGEPIPLPIKLLSQPLVQLCADLAAGGAAEAADHIRTTIESGDIEVGSLLAASLSRDQDAIRQGAVHRG